MYSYPTQIGIFEIVPVAGRWHIFYQGDSLGSYVSANQAAEGLACGHTFTTSISVDITTLGIPEDLGRWFK